MQPKRAGFIFVLTVFFTVLIFSAAFGQASLPQADKKPSLLLIYSSTQIPKASDSMADVLKNPIRHFIADVKEITVEDYKKGLIEKYDAIFYLGVSENASQGFNEFVDDAARHYKTKTICWIYAGVEKFLSSSGLGDVVSVEKDALVYQQLSYNSQALESDKRIANKVILKKDNDSKIPVNGIGILKGDKESAPFSVRIQNFWYFPVVPVNEDDYIVFCDILHSILDVPCLGQGKGRLAVFEIEGVNPATSPAKLRNICCVIAKSKARMITDLTPVDYKTGKRLSDNQFLMRMLNAMFSMDGPAVLNTRGIDSEQILNEQIDMLVENEILPLAAKDGEESFLSDHFSTIVKYGAVPFLTSDEKFKQALYINRRLTADKNDDPVSTLLAMAKKRLVLRDTVLCVAISPNMNPNDLKKIIKQLKRLGYKFFDLRRLPNYVRSDKTLIFSQPGFYSVLPYQGITYGGKTKMEMLKLGFDNEFAVQRVLGEHSQVVSENVSQLPVNGTALVDIPLSGNYFVMTKTRKPPTALQKYKKKITRYVLGRTSASALDAFNRIVVIIIFIMTLFLMFYMVNILYIQLTAGRYREL